MLQINIYAEILHFVASFRDTVRVEHFKLQSDALYNFFYPLSNNQLFSSALFVCLKAIRVPIDTVPQAFFF